MLLIDIHRGLPFQQSRWLSPHIEKTSTLRAASKNDFEKQFFKLMNNSIYWKTCDNQKKRPDLKLSTSEQKTSNSSKSHTAWASKSSTSKYWV